MNINVFIPHRWNNGDYYEIARLLDGTKYKVRDYSVPAYDAFESIDRRFNVDPQIQRQIQHASVVVCSNRPANNAGVAMDEIRFAINIGKSVVAVRMTDNTSRELMALGIPVIPKRKDSLEAWIDQNR